MRLNLPPEADSSTSHSSEGLLSSSEEVEKKDIVRAPAGSTFPRTKALEACAPLVAHLSDASSTISSKTREYAKHLNGFQKLPHSYWNGDGTIFRVRMGPNYKKTGKKEPSKKSLYDLYAVDFVRTEERIKESRDAFEVPTIPGITDIETGHPYIPPMFIVNNSMPSQVPSLFQSSDDGPSFVIIFYFVISEDTLEQLKDISKASPAVKLLGEWCRRAEVSKH